MGGLDLIGGTWEWERMKELREEGCHGQEN